MNHLRYTILTLCALALLAAGCSGSDSDTVAPTVDESSIVCDFASRSISFNADCPGGAKLLVLLRQLTNGNDEQTFDVRLRAGQTYFVTLIGLVGGSTYAYYVIGYDSSGKESSRSSERTFTVPKYGAPAAPSLAGLTAYSPSSLVASDGYLKGACLTTELEYSTDDGQSWKPVVENGFIRNLSPGKVLLRKAETSTTEAGKTTSATVPTYQSNTDMKGDHGMSEGLQ